MNLCMFISITHSIRVCVCVRALAHVCTSVILLLDLKTKTLNMQINKIYYYSELNKIFYHSGFSDYLNGYIHNVSVDMSSSLLEVSLPNPGTYMELRTTSTRVVCSDSVSHNRVQVLSIPVLLLVCRQDWTCNLHVVNITIKMKTIIWKLWLIKIIKLCLRNSNKELGVCVCV